MDYTHDERHPTPALLVRVRERRREVGLTQSQLAELTGISRQALSAIEAGRQSPSTVVSLGLARALGSSVDDLFRLRDHRSAEVRVGPNVREGDRVVVAEVGGARVAHAVRGATTQADGVALEGDGGGAPTHVHLFPEQGGAQRRVLVAGCAPLIGTLAERTSERVGTRASWVSANSTAALALLADGLVHVAGMHLADAEDSTAHERALRSAMPSESCTLVNLVRWRQGLLVAPGNPLGIKSAADVLRADVRVVRRDEGSAAEEVLRRAVGRSLPKPADAQIRARSHVEVAQQVAWGMADTGIAIEATAIEAGLDFIPLSEERFDLAVRQSVAEEDAVRQLLGQLDERAFKADAGAIPGYDLSSVGHALDLRAG